MLRERRRLSALRIGARRAPYNDSEAIRIEDRGEMGGGSGTRNRLSAGSEGGGRTAAILFGLATTCKALGIGPFAYLRGILDRVCTNPARRVAE